MPPLPKFPVLDGEKTCTGCGLSKPIADFYEVKKGTGKLFAACKPCIIAQQKANPRAASYMREWQEAHRERVRAYNRKAYAKNPSKTTDRQRERWANDPDWRMRKTAQTNNVRRGRTYSAEFELVTIEEIGIRDAWTCRLCGKPVDRALLKQPALARAHPGYPTIDHIQPLAVATDGCRLKPGDATCAHGCVGGSTVLANLQLAHGRCNKQKFTQFPSDAATTSDK